MHPLFRGRIIVVLSPQPWNYLNISKHHYSKALSKENTVIFISPPTFGYKYKVRRYEVEDRLSVIEYVVPIPEVIKFSFKRFYKFVAQFFLVKAVKSYFVNADFCFDFGWYQEFDSIQFFPAFYKIYFPVDDYKLIGSARGSNLVLTVSTQIKQKFGNEKCHFINHGLSEVFAEKARLSLAENKKWTPGDKINVGYSGNLFIPFLDIDIFQFLISNYPGVDFHLFGSDWFDPLNDEHGRWNSFLRTAANVKVYGRVTPERLSDEFERLDLFLICYKPDENYHNENSHKIMEYLSTGKVIVSSHISLYKETGLLKMPDQQNNELLKEIFGRIITNLTFYNSQERINERRKYALENTYEKQIERIARIIESKGNERSEF